MLIIALMCIIYKKICIIYIWPRLPPEGGIALRSPVKNIDSGANECFPIICIVPPLQFVVFLFRATKTPDVE